MQNDDCMLPDLLSVASSAFQPECWCREFAERTSSPFFGNPSDGLEVRPTLVFSCHKPVGRVSQSHKIVSVQTRKVFATGSDLQLRQLAHL